MMKPTLTLLHANAKGTGCGLNLELCPAQAMGPACTQEGCIYLRLAAQKTVGPAAGFDYRGAVRICLRFGDLCKLLQVLRGETESLEDGKGLNYREHDGALTNLRFRHIIDPVCGYEIAVVQKAGDEERCWRFLLTCWEALGICEAIAGAMTCVVFGVPALLLENTRGAVVATDCAGRVTAREVLK